MARTIGTPKRCKSSRSFLQSLPQAALFQGADKAFEKVFSGLQNLENFSKQFQEQIQRTEDEGGQLLSALESSADKSWF